MWEEKNECGLVEACVTEGVSGQGNSKAALKMGMQGGFAEHCALGEPLPQPCQAQLTYLSPSKISSLPAFSLHEILSCHLMAKSNCQGV